MKMNFNVHIQPQLNEIIADMLSEINPRECLLAPLNKANWWTSSDYKDIPLWYEDAESDCPMIELSIQEWMSVYQFTTGDNTSFNLSLMQQMCDTIENQWQIRMQEQDEDMRFEEEFEIERAAVA